MYIDYVPWNLAKLISPTSFIVDLGFSIYKIMPFVNMVSFMPFFPKWMSFISFLLLTALARTSSTILNRCAQRRHSYFVPDLGRKSIQSFALNMILVHRVFQPLEGIGIYWISSLQLLRWSCDFYPVFLLGCISLTDFLM